MTERRDSNTFTSDQAQEERAQLRSLEKHYDHCAKTGQFIRDDKGVVVTITSEKPVHLSARRHEVLSYSFRLSEKAARQLIGGAGATLKLKYAQKEPLEVKDGEIQAPAQKDPLDEARRKVMRKKDG